MKNPWTMTKFFRDAEGEGAGGGGEGATTPTPEAGEVISGLAARLARTQQQLDGMTADQKRQRTIDVIASRDKELTTAKTDADTAVTSAETALANAYDNGEGVEIAKAQRFLTEAVAKRERADIAVEQFRDQVKAAEKRETEAPKGGAPDDTNLNSWKEKHSEWYGVDAEMTKASHTIDRQIREAGVWSVGSKEYFAAIDKAMAQKFPDRLSGAPTTAGPGGGMSNPSKSPLKGRIQQSIADGWRRMGIDMSDPKTVERMVKNREAAVQKGILSETPVSGPVVTR